MNKKEFSSKQEHLVADVVGGNVITGSGSRPFTCGDVITEHFIFECKTHTKPQDKVSFNKKHWLKLREESRAANRYPVLVTDDGTQRLTHTWVMLPTSILSSVLTLHEVFGIKNTSIKGTSFTFDMDTAHSLYKSDIIDDELSVFNLYWDEPISVLPLEEFSEFIRSNF